MISISNYFVIFILALVFLPAVIHAEDYMYWDSNFDPISLLSIASQSQIREGSATVTLFTSGDAEISADNTAAAELDNIGDGGSDVLVTEYMLAFDGNGSSATGGTNTSYETYNTFISTPVPITYVTDDNDVDVTLWVRASNDSTGHKEVADSGAYTATQTLTVSWIGP